LKKINLLLAIHNHQPVGNFDFVFQDSYDRAYKPFLDLLARHPRVKVSLHYTGPLLDWFSKHRPEFYSKIGALLDSGQVEMMTGAYYEAILPVVPEEDGKGQIRKLSDTINHDFHAQPTGMWLAERVWEQHIARLIAESGVKFVLLDDTHFLSAGLKEDDLVGYYITEEQGRKLALFPTSKTLRYTIPFQPVQQTIDLLRSLATDAGDRVVTFGDDGEKFGVWPTTYKHVYEDGWLEEFFTTLEANSDWLHIRHFSDVLQSIPPTGRIYLPDSSYMEMGHWVLPSEAFHRYEEFSELLKADEPFGKYRQFVKGGFWRNFLVKYPEANTLHKKMLHLSKRAHSLERKGKKVGDALEYLWAGQCNDVYWHGVFGGLYLPHLRAEAFRNLLRAENILNSVSGVEGIRVRRTDFDCDGRDELLVESPQMNAYFKLDAGGSIFELDFLPISTNLGNVMTRREEGYHRKLLAIGKEASSSTGSQGVASIHELVLKKEENLDQYLAYDWYRRASLVDHFLGEGVTLEDFSRCRFPEQGDFVNQQYRCKTEKEGKDLRINLWRDGHVWSQNRHLPLRVSKTVELKNGTAGIELDYKIENSTNQILDLWFGIEFCFALSAGDAPDRYYRFDGVTHEDLRLRSTGALKGVPSMSLIDQWLGVDVALSFGQPVDVWRFPIETISLSEGGFERVYQGSVVFPNWHIRLERKWDARILLELKRISK
jgi:alpha-amylase/alpha-mannosidase (GH57 family)